MSTQSIIKNITITEPAAAEIFISAMEKAADIAETSMPYHVESKELSKDELEKFLGKIQ